MYMKEFNKLQYDFLYLLIRKYKTKQNKAVDSFPRTSSCSNQWSSENPKEKIEYVLNKPNGFKIKCCDELRRKHLKMDPLLDVF